MLRKIEHFCHYFAEYSNAYALIGGAACTAWYSDHIPSFRGTEDLDIVLILEYMDIQFTETFHDYINRSGYKIRERIDLEQDGVSRKILYRFSEPEIREPLLSWSFSAAREMRYIWFPGNGCTSKSTGSVYGALLHRSG